MSVNYLFMGYELTTDRLEAVLEEHGIDKSDLLSKLGNISKQRYNNWKKRGNVPQGMVPKISAHTGLPIDYLVGRGKPLNPKNRKLHEAIDSLPPEYLDRIWFSIKTIRQEQAEQATSKNQ